MSLNPLQKELHLLTNGRDCGYACMVIVCLFCNVFFAGQCTFLERPDTKVQGISPEYHFGTSSVTDCQQACLSDDQQPECWAVVFAGSQCYFFRAYSMAELIDHAEDNDAPGRVPLYVKICFQGKPLLIAFCYWLFTINHI